MIHPPIFFFYGSIQSFVHFSFNSYTVGCWYSQNAPESCSPSDWPDTPCNGKAQRNSMKVIHFKKFPCKTSLGWREVCEARPSPWNCWTQLGENRKSCLFFFFFPFSDIVHLAGIICFPSPFQCCSYTSTSSMKSVTHLSPATGQKTWYPEVAELQNFA